MRGFSNCCYIDRRRAARGGLSVLEFLGCVIAVVGGIWLGAIYLGVDVRHIAHTALSETELLDKVPPEWRPPGPQDSVTHEQLVTTLREELSSLKSEITSLRSGEKVSEPTQPETTPADPNAPPQPTKERTLAYWARLNEIALGEAALQADAESAVDELNAAKVFAIKGRIGRFAAKAVEAIPDAQVDPSVVQFGLQLKQWYEHGGELYDRAVQIWESAANSLGREQLNDDWKRAELQHKNEAQLLRDKADGVRIAISRRFAVEVPAFADAAQ
ncbi:MAG: hypothetical protein WD669_07130 [Pirellulales bacterium]